MRTRNKLAKRICKQKWEKVLFGFDVRLGKKGMLLSSHIIELQMRLVSWLRFNKSSAILQDYVDWHNHESARADGRVEN